MPADNLDLSDRSILRQNQVQTNHTLNMCLSCFFGIDRLHTVNQLGCLYIPSDAYASDRRIPIDRSRFGSCFVDEFVTSKSDGSGSSRCNFVIRTV